MLGALQGFLSISLSGYLDIPPPVLCRFSRYLMGFFAQNAFCVSITLREPIQAPLRAFVFVGVLLYIETISEWEISHYRYKNVNNCNRFAAPTGVFLATSQKGALQNVNVLQRVFLISTLEER